MSLALPTPIGVFDSGLGGLTVLRELQRTFPAKRYLYLGDNARCPYGTKGSQTIIRYSRECAQFLLRHEIGILVVACNTASAAALKQLEQELSIPVIGTIVPAVRTAISATTAGRIGVLGTSSTIASKVYEQALHEVNPELTIVSQPCPLFVPLVEAGMLDGEIVEKITDLYLEPLISAQVDTIILGCTHYPLLRSQIQKKMGDGVAIVECSKAIASEILTLAKGGTSSDTGGETTYYVTDEVSRFNFLAGELLGGSIEAIRVEDMSAYLTHEYENR